MAIAGQIDYWYLSLKGDFYLPTRPHSWHIISFEYMNKFWFSMGALFVPAHVHRRLEGEEGQAHLPSTAPGTGLSLF